MFMLLRQRVYLPVFATVSLFLFALIAAASGLIQSGKKTALVDSERQAYRFVSGAEVALNRSLLGVDVMLAGMTDLLQFASADAAIDEERISRLLRGAVNQNQLVRQISLLNEQEQVLASSGRSGRHQEIRLPDGFFAEVLAQTMPALLISSPMVNFANAEKVLFFARQMNLGPGRPVLAVAEVQIPLLSTIMAQGVDIEGLAVTLERADGELLVSVPASDVLSGTRITPPLSVEMANGVVNIAPSRLGGAPAIVVARPALYRGLLIAASIPLDSALADWRVERNRIVAVSLLFALMILLAGGGTIWYLARLSQARSRADHAKTTLDQALDSMVSGFVLLDAQDRVVSWNERYLEIFPSIRELIEPGMPFEHAFETSARNLLPEGSEAERQAWIQQQLERHRNAQGEYEQQYLNGLTVLMTERRTPDGGTVCMYSDISEKKRLEVEQRIASIAFEVQEGITITDAAMVILRVNRAFTEITGYNTEEIVGKTPALLSSGRHDAAFFTAMWESVARTGAWQGEIWNRRKCGEIYPEWLMITAVKDKAGTVTNYVGTFSDITARKAAEDEINSLAFFDPLTGLPNRRLLLDRLKQALASSTRNVKYGALLFIDLDHFKNLNDTRGHDIGDLLLQQVAERLTTCVRESDTVARLGGDEFVVMLEDLSGTIQEAANQAESVGEKILSTLNQTYALGSAEHHSTPSIGIALFADHSEGIDELLKRADLAMYEAKAAGRNTLRFFEPEMQTIVTARAAMEIGLREALANGHFFLHYQAQVTDVCGVAGAEALVRWRHPLRGTISPTEFIPLAEETGLIQPLGLWVLETACAQLARWAMQPGMAHLTLAVNVSARQFHQTDFVDQVLVVLERTGANPCRLKLELTESLLVTNIDGVIAKMSALKIIGVGFSLDDFGTGYSSLSYLSRLPLDQLKIDRSFVMNIESNDNAAAICAATISLAHALNLKVVAEGVETEAQRYFLNMVHHCDLIQGYLFSRPLPIDEFEALAASKVDFPDNQAITLSCAS